MLWPDPVCWQRWALARPSDSPHQSAPTAPARQQTLQGFRSHDIKWLFVLFVEQTPIQICASGSPVPSPQTSSYLHCQWHRSKMTNMNNKCVFAYSLETTCHNKTKDMAHMWLTVYATLHFARGNESFDSSRRSPKGQCFPGIFSRMAWSSAVPRCPKRWASCRERQRSLCWSPEVEHKVGVSAVHGAAVKWGAKTVSVWAYVQNESLGGSCKHLIYEMACIVAGRCLSFNLKTFFVTELLSFSASEVV